MYAIFFPSWQQCQMQSGIPLSRNIFARDPWLLPTNTQWLIAIPKGGISSAQKLPQDDPTRRCPQKCETYNVPVRPKQPGQKDFCSSPVIPLRGDKEKFNQILLAKQRKMMNFKTLSRYVAPSRVTFALSTLRDVCRHFQPMPWGNNENGSCNMVDA
jgi:hypothetical protein